LRDYLYFPLGGNQKGQGRTLVNLFVTMLLGGLWHGAGWTFVIWGGLHGIYLIINHVWRTFKQALSLEVNTWWSLGFARVLTFIAVVFAWVFFRAENLDSALAIVRGMSGINGFFLPIGWFYKFGPIGPLLEDHGVQFIYTGLALHRYAIVGVVVLLAIAWAFPNTQQIMAGYKPAFEIYPKEIKPVKWQVLQWKPNLVWAGISALFCFYIVLSLGKFSEFLYFQF
jgi:hypothetical protein